LAVFLDALGQTFDGLGVAAIAVEGGTKPFEVLPVPRIAGE